MSSQVGEQKGATVAEAAGGCVALVIGLGLVLMVGSCVFGSSDEKTSQTAPPDAPQVQSLAVRTETNADSGSSDAKAPDAAAVSEAEGTVAFIIGLNGYHCIKVIDAQDAGSGVYDVTCITNHHGHKATYMVNARTNDVAEI